MSDKPTMEEFIEYLAAFMAPKRGEYEKEVDCGVFHRYDGDGNLIGGRIDHSPNGQN